MSKATRLAKNTAVIAIGNMCTKGISFLLLPLYTSILSANEYGTVDIIGSYTSLLTVVLTLQLEQGLFRYLVESRSQKEKQRRYITATLVSVLCVLGLAIPLAKLLLDHMNYPYANYLLANIAVNVMNAIVLQIPRGLGDNITYTVGCFICGAAGVILNVLFVAVLGWGLEGMLLAGILGMAFCTVFVSIKTKLYTFCVPFRFDFEQWKQLLLFALPLVPYTMCWWSISASDRLIINMMMGVGYNGIYAVANKFPSILSMATGIFQTAWMESAFENVDDTQRNEYYNSTINRAVRFYSSCNLGIISLMPFVFQLLVDESYREAYGIIPILTTAVMFHAVSALYGAIYFAFKETKKVAVAAMFAALCNIVINVALISRIGLYAAAVSTLVTYFSMLLVRYVEMKQRVGIAVDNKYLLTELIAYVLVFAGYYSGKSIVQILLLLCVVPYCVICNKDLLKQIFSIRGKRTGR